jgi:hypothetical protein
MKITDNIGSLLAQGSKNASQKSKPDQSFSEVLVQVAQGPVEGSGCQKAGTISTPPCGLDPVTLSEPVSQLSQSADQTSLAAGLINELETTLDAFDHYREKLGDVSVPAGDLADIIGHLEDRIGRLQTLSATPATPEGLKEVTSSLMITMATEIEKFKRGDYV